MVAQGGAMTRSASLVIVISVSAAVLGSIALAAQDKYTVKVPNGLAFSEFRGYEDWPVIARSVCHPLLFLRERTQAKPLVHAACQRLVADQLDGPGIDLSLQRRVSHPNRSHAAQRAADVQIDVIPRIDAAKVDLPVFDHEPPVSAPSVDLRIDELHGTSAAVGQRQRFEIAPHVPHQERRVEILQ